MSRGLAIVGCGKMGRLIEQLAPEYGFDVRAKFTRANNLYEAGMTSHASVNVMLALEDAFYVEFPDEMLKRSVFESIANIDGALRRLHQEAA